MDKAHEAPSVNHKNKTTKHTLTPPANGLPEGPQFRGTVPSRLASSDGILTFGGNSCCYLRGPGLCSLV